MRYKLFKKDPNDTEELDTGVLRNSRKQIDEWCINQISNRGLDWRVGFMLKFRDERKIYIWRKSKDLSEVKPK